MFRQWMAIFLLPMCVFWGGRALADAGPDSLIAAPAGTPARTFSQTIAPLPSPEAGEDPLPVKSVRRFGTRLLLTIHQGTAPKAPSTASRMSFYRKNDAGTFDLLFEIHAGSGGDHFKDPVDFQFEVPGAGRQSFLFLTRQYSGTGHYHDDWIFRVNETEHLEPVEFIPGPHAYHKLLGPDEGIWKGEWNDFSLSPPQFRFWIWNKGDGNCCPSAGHVEGEYRVERLAEPGQPVRYRVSPAAFRRKPTEHEPPPPPKPLS